MREKYVPEWLTISTLLTLLRLVVVPFIMGAIITQAWTIALYLFIIAVITDMLDGALARLLDEQTVVGTYLDPVADKMLILGCYMAFVYSDIPSYIMPSWFIVVIIIKECLLMAGALYYGIMKNSIVVKPSWIGKGAMIAQSIFIFLILISLYADHVGQQSVYWMQQLVLLSVVAAFVHYAYVGFKGTRLWYFVKKAFCWHI